MNGPPDYNQHKFFLYFATFLILISMQRKKKKEKNEARGENPSKPDEHFSVALLK